MRRTVGALGLALVGMLLACAVFGDAAAPGLGAPCGEGTERGAGGQCWPIGGARPHTDAG